MFIIFKNVFRIYIVFLLLNKFWIYVSPNSGNTDRSKMCGRGQLDWITFDRVIPVPGLADGGKIKTCSVTLRTNSWFVYIFALNTYISFSLSS